MSHEARIRHDLPRGISLILGDCLDAMAEMPPNSVDAIVTDPPYGLSKEPDMAEVLHHWLAGDDYKHKGAGFMGKTWDSFVPGPSVWKEAYRVLKPGGHLLAFAGSRTQDLMGVSIRLAGFENRDCIMWVFGSGFPKSLDVSKAIDKLAGAEREVTGKSQYASRRPTKADSPSGCYGDGIRSPETTDATEAARQWDGWGTALKPAYEPCLMFRKPLAKGNTVAANVLEHGTGGINVGACRVGNDPVTICNYKSTGSQGCITHTGVAGHSGREYDERMSQGRWPANFIHDGGDEVIRLFPETKSGMPGVRRSMGFGGHDNPPAVRQPGVGDQGSAARFFYSAKASRIDRNEGCEGLEAVNHMRVNAPRGSEEEKHATRHGNSHPTVKPTSLMRYLVRLVTPPGGIVLDPFMGSGSTGKAAALEGFRFVGIELDPDYLTIAQARIDHAMAQKEQVLPL
jgi:DNA modification methylase